MSEIGMNKSELRIPEKAGGIRLRGSCFLFYPCPPQTTKIDTASAHPTLTA
jgi:hypothetical protein